MTETPQQQRARAYEEGRISTTDGAPPRSFDAGAPGPVKANGQHEQYWVLSAEERAKGFVRPVRRSYRHVGWAAPRYPLRDLTEEERERYASYGYVKYEAYPESDDSVVGRFWTQAQLNSVNHGCGTVTTMSIDIAETYARDPNFYGSTFCCGCRTHLRVGADGEFVWEGTSERVGT